MITNENSIFVTKDWKSCVSQIFRRFQIWNLFSRRLDVFSVILRTDPLSLTLPRRGRGYVIQKNPDTKKRLTHIRSSLSHVAVKLLLPVLTSVPLALESADALETARERLLAMGALAQELQEAGLLYLLLEPLLESVRGFVAVLVCVDCHEPAYVNGQEP